MITVITVYSKQDIDDKYRESVKSKVLSCANKQLVGKTKKKLVKKAKGNFGYNSNLQLMSVKESILNNTITDEKLMRAYDDISKEKFVYDDGLYIISLELPFESTLSNRELTILTYLTNHFTFFNLLAFLDDPDSGCTATDATNSALVDHWSDYPDSFADLDAWDI